MSWHDRVPKRAALGPVLAPLLLAARRLTAEPWLSIAIALGLLAAVAFTTSVPAYTNAVYARLLHKELHEKTRNYPPFAFMFHYLGSKHELVEWEEIQPVDTFLSGQAVTRLGLPQTISVRHFQTVPFSIFIQNATTGAIGHAATAKLRFAFQSDLAKHITLLEGRLPQAASQADRVEVLINNVLAQKMGWQVGETFIALSTTHTDYGSSRNQISFVVVGVWQVTDRQDEYWFYNPFALIRDLLLVSEDAFSGQISPVLKGDVAVGAWYMILDGSTFEVSDADGFLYRLQRVDRHAGALLAGTGLLVSPSAPALRRYQRSAQVLTLSLYAINIPIFGLILAYLWLVTGVYINRRRAEISLLRSRGASVGQIAAMLTLEGSLLGAIAWVGGLPAGEKLAQSIGRIQGFMDFSGSLALPVTISPSVVRIGMLAIGLALLTFMIPTLDAARHTLVSYRHERARSLQPWWHGIWLDVLLLLLALYGMFRLRSQGGFISLAADETLETTPLLDPLLFMTPVLWLLAIALLSLRALPQLMAAISWVAQNRASPGFLLAVRRLARTPRFYVIPQVLLILTLSLAIFTASLAQTMKQRIAEEHFYRIGADMRLVELGESVETDPLATSSANPQTGETASATLQEMAQSAGYTPWSFLPVAEHGRAAGVQTVTRVGHYKAVAQLHQQNRDGMFIGIDRLDFPLVGFWQRNFAQNSLGALMNTLALTPNGVLVPNMFLRQSSLALGDKLRVTVSIPEQRRELTWWVMEIDFQIVGSFDLFPTWDPSAGPLMVGNLDYVFEQAGGQFPFDVWLRTEPNPDYHRIEQQLREMGFRILSWDAPDLHVVQALQQPERQGVVGLLSIGFIAAALLTIVGFLLYTVSSFRERSVEIGVLRAIGLTRRELLSFMGWELLILLIFGLGVGTGLGIWSSQLFIPHLQLGLDPMALLLPLTPQIAWARVYQVYIIFGLLFVGATSLLTTALLRGQVTQAIKMGETI